MSVPELPLELLRCPSTGEPLLREADDVLASADGSHRYRLLGGIPMLIAPEKSVVSLVDYAPPVSASTVRARIARLGRRLIHMPPTLNSAAGSRDHYQTLAELLVARAADQGPQRVLVVGGATVGDGFEALLDRPEIEVIETDIALGPRTRIVCDGHDLPFVDGSFDAVVIQAVLEHVLDPTRVVSEIHRVLGQAGLAYSEVPFMQQVHEGAHDVTRFTLLGHRRLFRHFDEIESGAQGGPGMALGWSIRYFVMSFARSKAQRALITRLTSLMFFWLKYLDRFVGDRPGGIDAASGTYFLGRRRDAPVDDREVLSGYRGAGPGYAMLDRR
jgi:SAM-dependent methyltransferase